MPLHIGILIIGSLLWREDRQKWRDDHLDMKSAQRVTAPIRYGRRSQSWGNAYTMVLARSGGIGCAKVVPCSQSISAPEELVAEAERLWRAEQPSAAAGRISADWGCVALLRNPERAIPDDLKKVWAERVSGKHGYGNIPQEAYERRLVSRAGLLQMNWPCRVVDGVTIELDLLLVTTNDPTLSGTPPSYPTAESVANAWKDNESKYAEYFWRNVDNGITTFQDDEIRTQLLAAQA